MNTPIKDAFVSLQTQGNETAQVMIKQALTYRSNPIGERIRALKNLVYDTFVRMDGASPRARKHLADNGLSGRDIYNSARDRIKDLGVKGGWDYSKAMALVKDAWESPEAWQKASEFVTDGDAYEIAVRTKLNADPEQEASVHRIIAKLKKDAGILVRA